MNKRKCICLAAGILALLGLGQAGAAYEIDACAPAYEAEAEDKAEIMSVIWEDKAPDIVDKLNPAPPSPQRWTDQDVTTLARMVWGEGRGVSRNEQKLIVWTVLNRLDNGRYGSTIRQIVTARGQFVGYRSGHPVTDAIREMVIYVLEAWDRGETAKVYPPFARDSNYLYFHGDGRHNWFRTRYRG